MAILKIMDPYNIILDEGMSGFVSRIGKGTGVSQYMHLSVVLSISQRCCTCIKFSGSIRTRIRS